MTFVLGVLTGILASICFGVIAVFEILRRSGDVGL